MDLEHKITKYQHKLATMNGGALVDTTHLSRQDAYRALKQEYKKYTKKGGAEGEKKYSIPLDGVELKFKGWGEKTLTGKLFIENCRSCISYEKECNRDVTSYHWYKKVWIYSNPLDLLMIPKPSKAVHKYDWYDMEYINDLYSIKEETMTIRVLENTLEVTFTASNGLEKMDDSDFEADMTQDVIDLVKTMDKKFARAEQVYEYTDEIRQQVDKKLTKMNVVLPVGFIKASEKIDFEHGKKILEALMTNMRTMFTSGLRKPSRPSMSGVKDGFSSLKKNRIDKEKGTDDAAEPTTLLVGTLNMSAVNTNPFEWHDDDSKYTAFVKGAKKFQNENQTSIEEIFLHYDEFMNNITDEGHKQEFSTYWDSIKKGTIKDFIAGVGKKASKAGLMMPDRPSMMVCGKDDLLLDASWFENWAKYCIGQYRATDETKMGKLVPGLLALAVYDAIFIAYLKTTENWKELMQQRCSTGDMNPDKYNVLMKKMQANKLDVVFMQELPPNFDMQAFDEYTLFYPLNMPISDRNSCIAVRKKTFDFELVEQHVVDGGTEAFTAWFLKHPTHVCKITVPLANQGRKITLMSIKSDEDLIDDMLDFIVAFKQDKKDIIVGIDALIEDEHKKQFTQSLEDHQLQSSNSKMKTTTMKKRTALQMQVKKIDKESRAPRDHVLINETLKFGDTTRIDCGSTKMLPSTDHPTDHCLVVAEVVV